MSEYKLTAKPVVYSWNDIQVYDQSQQVYCLTPQQAFLALRALYAQAQWRTRWMDGEDFDAIQAFVADTIYNLENPCALPESVTASQRGGIVIIEKEKGDMLKVERFGDEYYLEMDCGCGERKYFNLSDATVDPLTGAPLTVDGQIGPGGALFPEGGVSSGNASCYATKATDYFIDRFLQYTNFVLNLSANALDSLLLDFDEIANTIAILTQITDESSIVQEIRDRGYDAVEDAVTLQRNNMIAAWTFEGAVSNADLGRWINDSVPWLVSGFPLRPVMQDWLRTSRVPGYNRDLARLASECENNNEVTPIQAPTRQSADYNWFEIGPVASGETVTFSRSGFAGLLLKINATQTGDPGTAVLFDEVTVDLGGTEYALGGSVGSSSVTSDMIYVMGEDGIGEEAAARFGVYLEYDQPNDRATAPHPNALPFTVSIKLIEGTGWNFEVTEAIVATHRNP